jgi:hypothetical protein
MSKSIEGYRLAAWLLAAGLLALTGCGITAPHGNDGFADLDSLGMRDTDRVISLSIGPTLLRFAASQMDDDQTEVRDLLRSLDGVRIRVYEVNGDSRRVAGRMDRMSRELQADGWEPVMLIRQENEQTHMLLRMAEDRICGMTVLVLDGATEAVVINLMGEISPEHFGDVMVALDMDAGGVDKVEVAAKDIPNSGG